MNDRYTKKTIEMHESLLKFKDELSNIDITNDNRKRLKGLAKSYSDNWDKHTRAKGIINSDLDVKFKSVLKQIEFILSDRTLNESKIKDIRSLIYVLDEIDNSQHKLNTLIKDTLADITRELDNIRINTESKVNISEIIDIEINSDETLIKDISIECVNRANRLQDCFNRFVDAVDILEELSSKTGKE